MATHLIMDRSGHRKIDFDSTSTVELTEALDRFNDLTSKGYRAAVKRGDGVHELIRKFDPEAEQTLFIPQLRGG